MLLNVGFMHRFFENIQLQTVNIIQLNYNNSCKILNVLKLKINQEIYLFNNTNLEFFSKIIKVSNKTVYVEILNTIPHDLESPLKIHLAQAIAKHDNMDLIIQKSTELGVDEITPIISDRTIVKPKNYATKIDHWRKIAIASCAQCGRNLIPTINSILSFKDFIKIVNQQPTINEQYLKLILSPSIVLNEPCLLDNQFNNYKKIWIIIGPEGGFTPSELNLAEQNQFNLRSLGPRILRSETAPIAIISILQAKFGDLLKS